MKKFSTVIACKRNRFDFWNSCKRLQNFANVEALVSTMVIVRLCLNAPLMEAHSCQLCICFILFCQDLGGQLDYFGLWIDNSFNHGHSKAVPKCTTYGSP